MRIFLPLIAILFFSISAIAQPQFDIIGDLSAGVHNDVGPGGGYTTTYVVGETKRQYTSPTNVTFNHLNQSFIVNGLWLGNYNIGPHPDETGSIPGNNEDYFQFQGNSTIEGSEGIIVFDDVYFNIGAGNTMNITNYNSGYNSLNGNQGQPQGGILITNRLTFNNGITTTDRTMPVKGSIVFNRSAGYGGGLSDAQHVDGFVSEYNSFGGSQAPGHGGAFTFPVGNANSVYQLRRQGVFNDTESQFQLTVGWVDGDVNDPTTEDPTQGQPFNTTFLPFDLPGISLARPGFWDWQFQDQTDDPATPLAMPDDQTITVSIPSLTAFPGLQASDLRLIGYNSSSASWIDLSSTSGLSTPYASGLTKGSTLKGIIPGGTLITAILIGSTNAIILPVTFNSFTVKSEDCKALLQWETSSEQNNSHFTVERSTDGSTFTAIARVGAVGNSSNLNTYKYTDEAPAGGINYYRITQVDFDGKHSSTKIKAVKIQCNGGNEALLRAYPNPATNQVYIQTGKPVARVNILSSNGQTVLKYIPSQTEGGGTFPVNIQRLQRGIYLLQLVNKDGTVNVVKLLKQ